MIRAARKVRVSATQSVELELAAASIFLKIRVKTRKTKKQKNRFTEWEVKHPGGITSTEYSADRTFSQTQPVSVSASVSCESKDAPHCCCAKHINTEHSDPTITGGHSM